MAAGVALALTRGPGIAGYPFLLGLQIQELIYDRPVQVYAQREGCVNP